MKLVLDIKREALNAQLPPQYQEWEKLSVKAAEDIFQILISLPNQNCAAKAMVYAGSGAGFVDGFQEAYDTAATITKFQHSTGALVIEVREVI